jgi:hypothetical protein
MANRPAAPRDDLGTWLGIFLEKRRLKAEAKDAARASPGQPRPA